MIKANEYRLGIIVMDVEPYDKIYEVDINRLVNAINGISYRPIPLTPEWLERCGFVADRNGWHIPGKQFSLTDKFYPCWLGRMLWPQDIPDFKQLSLAYLHQLQNLYFALTGEELNVKL